MLNSTFCDYSDTNILVSGTTTVVGGGKNASARVVDKNNKEEIFKNCAPFTSCITEINNTKVDNAKDLDVVMPMYDLIEYIDSYSKTSGSLYQFCRDQPNNVITESESFKFKSKFLDNANNSDIKNAKIAVLLKYLKYLNTFWRNAVN